MWYKYNAFTLAEVLITLGIIGVVAAITLPSLVNNYKEKELISRTKKVYSNLQNAILMSQRDMGVIGDNTVMFDVNKTSAEVAENFVKYFNGATLCKTKNDKGCKKYYYETLYATKYTGQGDTAQVWSNSDAKIILNDGAVVNVSQFTACKRTWEGCEKDETGNCKRDENDNIITQTNSGTNCASLYFDVNGPKPPNQFGADTYAIFINPDNAIAGNNAIYGWKSLQNILTGKDKLEYSKYAKGEER